jgi:hypothetical protein
MAFPALRLALRIARGSGELWADTLTSPLRTTPPPPPLASGHVALLVRENLLVAKVLQSFAAQRLETDRWYSPWLKNLHDELLRHTNSVPYDDASYELGLVQAWASARGWGVDDDEPAHAGTVSLVFLMTDPVSGKRYVAKVLRSGIRERLEQSLSEAWMLAQVVAWMGNVSIATAQRGIETIFDSLLQQTDVDAEAEACRRFGAACQHIDGVVIPQPVAVVSGTMLVLEHFDGVPLHELPASSPHRDAYARALIKAVLIPILLHGMVHADLHAGNVLFRESDGVVAIIDFGLFHTADEVAMDGMVAAMPALLAGDADPSLFGILAKLCVGGVLSPPELIDDLSTEQHTALVSAVAEMLQEATEARDFGMVSITTRFMPRLRALPGCEKLTVAPYGIQLWQAAAAVRALAIGLGGSRADLVALVESTLRGLVHLDLFNDDDPSEN